MLSATSREYKVRHWDPYALKNPQPRNIHKLFQDFAIQQLERRISRMQGEQSNEEKIQLEIKIKKLNEELEEKVQTHNLLSLQRKRLQDDVRRVKRDLHKTQAAKDELTSKIEELHLHNDSSERQLRLQINEKQVNRLTRELTLCKKKPPTKLATSKNVLLPGHNHLLTTNTDDPTL